MSRLHRLEDLIARRVEHAFRLRGGLQPDDVVRQLRRALDRGAEEILGKTYVPNRVVVLLSPEDHDRLEVILEPMRQECLAFLEEHITRSDYVTIGTMSLNFDRALTVKGGEVRVECEFAKDEDEPAPVETRRPVAGSLHVPGGPSLDVPAGVSILGRGEESDVRLDDDTVSRRHARLTVRGDRLEVTDLGSRNGIRFRGKEVRKAELTPGDKVGIGAVTLEWSPA